MAPTLLVFSGRIASGKSSVSQAAAATLGWPWISFGDYVRQVAATQGLEPTRENWQNLGESLLQSDVYAFCRAVLAQAPAGSSHIVVDGIRHQSVLDELSRLVAPRKLFHVHLQVDEETRTSRIVGRGEQASEMERVRADQHITEQQVTACLSHVADLVLDASLPIDKLTEKILSHQLRWSS